MRIIRSEYVTMYKCKDITDFNISVHMAFLLSYLLFSSLLNEHKDACY